MTTPTQTLREKLELMIEALDAGETEINTEYGNLLMSTMVSTHTISRISPPPKTIEGYYADGTKWEITAPLREVPELEAEYWIVEKCGQVMRSWWGNDTTGNDRLEAASCWATQDDAQAWADVSKRIRSGK